MQGELLMCLLSCQGPVKSTARGVQRSLHCFVLSHLLFLLKVDCLVLQLHRIGEQLEKMNSQRMDELFSLLRDGFLLQEGLSSLSQLLLLEIIEFRAAEWKMTDAAQKYYYSEVTD